MKTIRYAIIGCGDHALQSHAIPGLSVDGLELVAICDPNPDSIKVFSEALDFHGAVMDENVIMNDRDIDAVLIASPDQFHALSLHHAIHEGKHVLCEKPLASVEGDLGYLEAAIEIAAGNQLVLTSCHPRRFDPPYLWLAKTMSDHTHRYGKVLSVHLDFSYHAPSKDNLHHGLLIDHVNHELDLVNFLFGHSPTWVRKLFDSQTHYQAVGKRNDGIALFFEGTRRLHGRVYPELATLRFERATVTVYTASGTVVVHDHETGRVIRRRYSRQCKTNYPLRFSSVMQNFVDVIRGDKDNYLTPKDLHENSEIGVVLTTESLWDPYHLNEV